MSIKRFQKFYEIEQTRIQINYWSFYLDFKEISIYKIFLLKFVKMELNLLEELLKIACKLWLNYFWEYNLLIKLIDNYTVNLRFFEFKNKRTLKHINV